MNFRRSKKNGGGMFTTFGLHATNTELERWPFIVHIMLGRLLVLGGVFLAGSAVLVKFETGFYFFSAFAFLATIPYAMWLKTQEGVRRCAYVQFFIDALITTGLIHYSGGIQSQLFFIYPLIIIGAGVVVSGSFAMRISVFCVALYSTEIALEAHGVLPFRGTPPLPYLHMDAVMQNLMLRIFVFTIYSAASSYLADFTSWQGRQIHRYTSLVNTIFDRMKMALFAVTEDGGIVLANQAGAEILQTQTSTLKTKSLFDFLDAPEKLDLSNFNSIEPERINLKNAKGEKIPVVCEVSKAVLPPALIHGHGFRQLFNGAVGKNNDVDVFIVAMRNISLQLENEESMQELCKLQTTVCVVTELAHHVRNTLTSIQCATGLTARIANDMKELGDNHAEDVAAVMKMDEIVNTQVDELEKQVNLFLDSATENPAALAREASNAYQRYFGKQ